MRRPDGVSIEPSSGSWMPSISFNRLDLAAPWRPTKPTRAFGGSEADALSRTRWPPRRSVMPSMVSMGADLTAPRLLAPRPYFVPQFAGFLPMLTLPHESPLPFDKRTRSDAMPSPQGHGQRSRRGYSMNRIAFVIT